MNKSILITISKQLDDKLYVFSVYDMEPSGILIQAYNQESSKEYLLAISERELVATNLSRDKESLKYLLNNTYLEKYEMSNELALQTGFDTINKQKKRPTGDDVQAVLTATSQGEKSINDILCTGMVELCKTKPGGLSAVKWLGEWLLANNPRKPCVEIADDE